MPRPSRSLHRALAGIIAIAAMLLFVLQHLTGIGFG
jgi:hypothetical protein